jgi:hypothetical protein
MFKILLNDIYQGKETISQLIYEYAPPSENDTEKYIQDVVTWTGISRNESLQDQPEKIIRVCAAMVRKETGENLFLNEFFAPYQAAATGVPVPGEPSNTLPLLPLVAAVYLFS